MILNKTTRQYKPGIESISLAFNEKVSNVVVLTNVSYVPLTTKLK